MSNKVVFGIRNVHYAIYDSTAGTYGTPVAVPGAVKLALTREGNSDKFYADDGTYVAFETNAGYTGELEMAYAPAQMLIDLVGYVKDSHGIVIEDADAIGKPFALLYEVSSNVSPDRFAFYECTLSRPENEANTRTDSTDPDTQTLNVTMVPHQFPWGKDETKRVVKGYVTNDTEGASAFASWFTSVTVPTKASA